MTQKAARPILSVQWLPAERLGLMTVEPTLRTWLIAKGMLSARVRAACGEDDPLATRALRDAEVKPESLWARRSRVALCGAPLATQEVFFPGMGRSQTGT
jgi:chorismate-pyruvate lyase